MTDKSLTDKDWLVVEKLVQLFTQEQLRIEPTKNGLITELKKVITYLYAKVSDNNLQPEQVSKMFFEYLRIWKTQGKQVARSGKTPDYYQSINKICSKELKAYSHQPDLMLCILGWTARLIPHYKENNQLEIRSNAEINNSSDVSRPKPKLKAKAKAAGPTGKTTMELALEKARKNKQQ